jgi:hypothetical protein
VVQSSCIVADAKQDERGAKRHSIISLAGALAEKRKVFFLSLMTCQSDSRSMAPMPSFERILTSTVISTTFKCTNSGPITLFVAKEGRCFELSVATRGYGSWHALFFVEQVFFHYPRHHHSYACTHVRPLAAAGSYVRCRLTVHPGCSRWNRCNHATSF